MPEIIEVEIQAEGLRETVVGDKIVGVNFFPKGNKIIRPVLTPDFAKQVVGKEITFVTRRGKYIVIELDKEILLTSHLAMTGRWLLDVPEEEVGHTRIEFKLISGRVLRYSDVRVFGRIRLVEDLTAKIYNKGLDVLNASREELENRLIRQRIKKGHVPIKKVLNDQNVLCGLGNVYVNEILWEGGIFPGKNLWEFSEGEIKELVYRIKSVLSWGYNAGGLSLKDYYHVDGTQGSAQLALRVYQKTRCHDCKYLLVKTDVFDDRATYYCPTCQSGK